MRAIRAGGLALVACAALAACERPQKPAEPAPAAPGESVNTGDIPQGAPVSFSPIIKRVSPAVVSIDTLAVGGPVDIPPGVIPGMAVPVRQGAGSGFIVSADGYVVTNAHVVAAAQEIVVTLADGRQLPARLVGADRPTDLAVLKVDARDLPFVSFARSALPEVGDWVVAVGNPFGLGGTATAGIVSAHSREIGETYVRYIQIDAPINSGNSGGPSFDLQGRVVGVNTAILSPTGGSVGIGFAIPAELAERVVRQLIQDGRVTRGYLGVGVQDLNPALAAQLGLRGETGAVVVGVERGGPAAGALQPGDVIVAVGGEEIPDAGGLTRRIAEARPGDSLSLRVVRQGRTREVTVRAARRPPDAG